jgi:putative endonuclease
MNRERAPCVYILASRRNGTLYTGVTSDMPQRIFAHRSGLVAGFTRQYGVKLLTWFEPHATMASAIQREKGIKKWNRAWKLELIEKDNPDWRDLAEDLGFTPLD